MAGSIKIRQVEGLPTALDNKASALVSITAGAGLTGGGNLTASRTIALSGAALALHNLSTNGLIARTGSGALATRSIESANVGRLLITNGDAVAGNPVIDLAPISGLVAGTYKSVTVDVYGRVIAATNPTTLAGYGITDAIPTSGGTMAGELLFANGLGSGNPTLTTRSAGTRIVLRNTVSALLVDTAIGYQAGNMWFSVQDGITANQFKWFGGETLVATLDGTGNFHTQGKLSTASSKSFIIKHPTKNGWKLEYACLEGPECGVYVRGRVKEYNEIELPEHWRNLVHAKSISVHITANNRLSYYVRSIKGARTIRIEAKETDNSELYDFTYLVYAERKDIPKLVVEYPG